MKANNTEVSAAFKSCVPHLILALFLNLAVSLLFLAKMLYMMSLFDRGVRSSSVETVILLLVAALVAYTALAVFDYLSSLILLRAGARLDQSLAPRLFGASVRGGLEGAGPQNSQCLRDLDTLRQFLSGTFVKAVIESVWIPIFFAVIWMLHPLLAIVAMAGGVIIVAMALANEFVSRRSGTGAGVLLRAHVTADSAIRNAEAVEGMGMTTGVGDTWLRERRGALFMMQQSGLRSAFFSSVSRFVRLSFLSVLMAVAAWLVIRQEVGPSVIFATMVLAGRAFSPLESSVSSWRSLTMAREAKARISTLLELAPKPPKTMSLPRPDGQVTLERVVFAPEGYARPVLRGITLTVKPGEFLGVVGPSGAGKTSLARLIIGTSRPTSGTVRLDGADVTLWNRQEFGRHVGYLPQSFELLPGSVRDNIARFTDAPDEEVVVAARRAGIHDLILRLPSGYDTDLAASPHLVSGGQRQRLALARALFGDPRLLVLDEPNSNLDPDGERALVSAIQEAKGCGTTIIMIAHRPTVLALADRLMVVRDGMIEMIGEREAIMARLSSKVVRPSAFARVGNADEPPADGAGEADDELAQGGAS